MLIVYTNLMLFNKALSCIDSFSDKKSFKENKYNRLIKEKK